MVYTDEVMKEMIADYQAAKDDDERAKVVRKYSEKLDKPEASIRAKLSLAGVYIAKRRTNHVIEKKSDIVEDIAKKLNVNSEVIESLEKANKNVLKLLRERL